MATPTPDTKAVATLEKELTPYLKQAIKITTPAEMSSAAALLSTFNKYGDKLKARKEEITKPLNAALKSARALFSPLEEKVEERVSAIRSEMSRYQIKAEELAKEKEDKLAKKVESGYMKPETAVAKMDEIERPDTNISTDEGSVQFRDKKCFEVMDITMLPIEYHLADESAIRKAMQAGTELAGVRYYVEKVPVNFR